ncbi:hypothetical protein GGI04_006088, partial [Coemansia thaxteri]
IAALFKRRVDREDPANPVAAAAIDPNVAAMRIKSRDLIPTDRPNIHPNGPHRYRHPASHGRPDDDGSDSPSPDAEEDSGDPRPRNKNSARDTAAKHKSTLAKDDDDSDSGFERDGEGDGKRDKPKPSNNGGKAKDTKFNKGDDKRPQDKGGKNSQKKKTHTGLDGNEVADDGAENDEESEVQKKKILVKHIQAKQRRWRTGKPKYDYKKALAGWKEVGPLYYYKGKYENSAQPLRSGSGHVALAALAAIIAYSAYI